MALLFCDGFDHVDDGYELLKWDYVYNAAYVTYATTYGRDGGWGMVISASAFLTLQKNLSASPSTIIVGFASKIIYQYDTRFFAINDGSDLQIQLWFDNSTGALKVYRDTTYLGITPPGSFNASTWHYIELKVVFSNTVGSVEIKIDGTTQLTLTDIDTSHSGNEQCTGIQLLGQANNPWTFFDDLYICDTTGTVNNDFLGDITITTLYPTSDGNSSDFTPSTGTDHYALVDEAQLVGDTDHNESSTVGHKDLYGVTTFSGTDNILGVQVVAAVKNTDTGTMSVRPLSRSGAIPADNEGDSFTLSQTMKAAMHVFEKEPTDDVAWTAAKVNAAEFGLKVQS